MNQQTIGQLLYLQNNICILCKKPLTGTKFVIHHLNKDRANNTLENLIIIHHNCHATLHTKEMLLVDQQQQAYTKLKEEYEKATRLLTEIHKIHENFEKRQEIDKQIRSSSWYVNKNDEITKKHRKNFSDILKYSPTEKLKEEAAAEDFAYEQEMKGLHAEANVKIKQACSQAGVPA